MNALSQWLRRIAALRAALALLAACSSGAAFAQSDPMDAHGAALLYDTHCRACHTQQVHWRDGRIATDWTSLVAQVRRWQGNLDLDWSDDEIRQVAHYLNLRFYRFPPGSQRLIVRSDRQRAS